MTAQGFTLALPPDWHVMDLHAETAPLSARRRIDAAVTRTPSLAPHKRLLTETMCAAAEQARISGVRLAAGWAASARGGPICAGLVVHVTPDPPTNSELCEWLRHDRDAAHDRSVHDDSGVVRVTETRSLVTDRRSRRAVPTTVVRFLVRSHCDEATARPSSLATLTFTTTASAERAQLVRVFDTVASTFVFTSLDVACEASA